MRIASARFDDPVAESLVTAALADLAGRYGGPGDATVVAADEFTPPVGEFLVAWVAGEPAGCGGWRTLRADPTAGEIKRMYTVERYRRRGVAATLLRAIEDSARSAGRRRLVLETGDRQPEALALYERSGYHRISNFGYYRDAEGCISYGREL